MWPRINIQARLLLVSLGITLMIIVALGSAGYFQTSHILRQAVIGSMEVNAENKIQRIEFFVREGKGDIAALARVPVIMELTERLAEVIARHGIESDAYAALDARISSFMRDYLTLHGYVDAFLFATNGDLIYSYTKGEDFGSNFRTGPYRRSTLAEAFGQVFDQKTVHFSNYDYYPATNEQGAFVAAPVFRDDRLIGVVAVLINNETLHQLVADYTGLGQTGEMLIGIRSDDEALLIAPTRHDPYAAFRRRYPLAAARTLPLVQAVQGHEGQGQAIDYRDQHILAVWRYLPDTRWGIVVKIDQAEALAPVARLRRTSFLLGLGASFLAVCLSVWTARSISRPITQLTTSAQRIAGGDLTQRPDLRSRDEVGVLARSLNTMIDRLQQQAKLSKQKELLEVQLSERQRAEAFIRQSEERLQLALKSAGLGTWECDYSTQQCHLDEFFCPLFGLAPAKRSLASAAFLEHVHSEDRPSVAAWLSQPSPDRDTFGIEFRVLHPDQSMHWLASRGRVYWNNSHEAIRLAAVCWEVTERKEAEARLQRQTEALAESEGALREKTILLESILDNIADGVIVADETGKFVIWNKAAERILNLGATDQPPEEWSKHYGVFLPDTTTLCPTEELPLYKALQGISVDHQELFIRHPNAPHGVWISVGGRPLTGSDQRIRGGVVVFHDMTFRRQAQEELKAHAALLARSNEELKQFAYVASHDLQEPLRSIVGYLQLLQKRYEGKLDASADKFISRSVNAANRMQTLIQDLLQFSRADRALKPMADVDFEKVLHQVEENLAIAIKESSAIITHDPLPILWADEKQMVQLLQNLIGNAVKFGGQRQPVIHVSAIKKRDAWHFSVRDNGIGIASEHFERIFLIFQRLHGREEYGGTGIGLAICKKTVERHGGQIWVESIPGQGSTFHFSIPERPQSEATYEEA